MSTQANRSLIGTFVLGATALLVTGIVVFGSGTVFSKVRKSVMFFEGSVKGLQVGSPVVFHGARIGQVTDIIVKMKASDLTAVIPVYVEIYPDKIVPLEGSHTYDEKFLAALVEKGLRAQLQSQSFVTGQLMVNLDFHPDAPIRTVGFETRYPEIPTIPSEMQQFAKKFEDLPLKDIADRFNETLVQVNRLLASPDVQTSVVSLNRLLGDADVLVKNLNSEVGPLGSEITRTTAAAQTLLGQAEKTLRFDEGVPGDIAARIQETLTAGQDTLKETTEAVRNLNVLATQNADLGQEIGGTLEEITRLSRSLTNLADYLERHPEALIRGKRPDHGH
jgi:phospholipid/cholesterol/gamma-HCH transport system substrate-binding protein